MFCGHHPDVFLKNCCNAHVSLSLVGFGACLIHIWRGVQRVLPKVELRSVPRVLLKVEPSSVPRVLPKVESSSKSFAKR